MDQSPVVTEDPASVIARRIGKELRRLRKERRLTQRELASRSGLSFSFINQVERGKRTARLDAIMRLATFYGMELNLVRRPR